MCVLKPVVEPELAGDGEWQCTSCQQWMAAYKQNCKCGARRMESRTRAPQLCENGDWYCYYGFKVYAKWSVCGKCGSPEPEWE